MDKKLKLKKKKERKKANTIHFERFLFIQNIQISFWIIYDLIDCLYTVYIFI